MTSEINELGLASGKADVGDVRLHYSVKRSDLFKHISADDARWLGGLVSRLSQKLQKNLTRHRQTWRIGKNFAGF